MTLAEDLAFPVTFGKYKGRTVEDMLDDKNYVNWMINKMHHKNPEKYCTKLWNSLYRALESKNKLPKINLILD